MDISRKLLAVFCAAAVMLAAGCAEKTNENGSGSESSSSSDSADINDSRKDKKDKKDKKEKQGDVRFSEESGFYPEPFELELEASKNSAKIYYTTDGSTPDENSTLYTEPIKLVNRTEEPNDLSAHTDIVVGEARAPYNKVKKANIIRAAAFGDSGMIGEVETRTYFIGIDREKEYGTVPVLSLVTPVDGLFGYENGIYILGKTHDDFLAADPKNKYVESFHQDTNYTQRGMEWERETSVELLEADGEGFSQTMGLRTMGAASRNECQKSFRLTARKEYGKKNLKYDIIPDNMRSDGSGEVEKYKSFVLRNGGNDCNGTKLRDPLIQSLVSERAFDTLQTAPAVVFLNGEYWGMYTITEDYSDNYIENNYGIDKDNVIMIKRSVLEEGEEGDFTLFTELYDYITGNDMSDADNYAKAAEMLDMQGFADLCAVNTYINNEDGLFQNNNYRFWRVRTPDNSCEQSDGKWRVLLYDTEYSTGVYDGGMSAVFDTVGMAIKGEGKAPKEVTAPPSKMFESLIANEQFKDMYIMALCDMRNICFNKDHVNARITEMAATYRPLVKGSFERFGPEYADFDGALWGLTNFMNTRYDKFMKMITDNFGEMRKVDVDITKCDGGRILVNGTTADPTVNIKGQYFAGSEISFTAVPDEGKKFVEWRYIGNCTVDDDKSPSIKVVLDGELTITAVFE